MNRADMKSKNMNYCFNVEYYKDLKYIYYIGQKDHDEEKEADEQELKKSDNAIENFKFSICTAIYNLIKKDGEQLEVV